MINGEDRKESPGFCPNCCQPKAGTKIGQINGIGWASPTRTGRISICINPQCEIGKKNLAEKKLPA